MVTTKSLLVIRIYSPDKTRINQELSKKNNLTHTWYITTSKLLIHPDDLEEVEKIFSKLESPYKIL